MMRLWVGLLVLCGAVGWGQSAGRIEGHVLDQDGVGVRKATVRLQGNPPPQNGQPMRSITLVEISDGTGKFVFEDLGPGRYVLSATKSGFTAPRSSASNYTPITIQTGEVRKDAEVKLVQLGVISGRVTDQDGDPLIGIQVQALHVQYNGARRQLTPYTSGTSDDQGNFRIANLEPGRYYPMVDDPRRMACGGNAVGEERRGRTAQEIDVTTFYPSSPDFSGAVAVNVAAGREAQSVNIRMLRGRVFSIRGSVLDTRITGAASAQLTLTPKNSGIGLANNRVGAQMQTNGGFEFCGLLPGIYTIQAVRAGQVVRSGDLAFANPGMEGRLEVAVATSNVEGVAIALSPLAELTGTLQMDEGGLQALRASGYPGQIVLTDSEGSSNASPTGQVNSDGSFKISNVGLSRYWVTVGPLSAGMYVKSIRLGGQDATKALLDMSAGGGGALEITLSKKAAEVTGLVRNRNGESVPGASVSIWPRSSEPINPARVRVFSTGANGDARLIDLAPGEYYVAAWEEIDQSLIRFPDFLARFAELASPVRLNENDRITTDLTLIPKDKIAAEVAKLP